MQYSEKQREMLARIDRAIGDARETLTDDIVRLIGIKSVKGEPEPGAPFGRGPRNMLDECLRMGKAEGFSVTDYGVGVVSLAFREGQPDLGIWLHGDVVPEGEDWNYPPYAATLYKGCVIGRGASDNKGQLCAIWNLFKIFRDLQIPLSYNPALYVGSDEECGMHDMSGVPGNPDARGFMNVCTPPRMSLVPDGGFPLGYGGKGKLSARLTAKQPIGAVITARLPQSPGKAEAEWNGEHFETFVPPKHSAHPSADGNALTRLTEQLLEKELPDYDRRVLTFLHTASLDIYGAFFGIDEPSEGLGRMALDAGDVRTVDGRPELTVGLRFVDTVPDREILARIRARAEENGFEMTFSEVTQQPYLLDVNDPMIAMLADIANEVRGTDKKPYTLSGATYAHRLPNAYVYGMNGCLRPEDFPKDRGDAHGLDELVSLDRLQAAMRVYARTMLKLDEKGF